MPATVPSVITASGSPSPGPTAPVPRRPRPARRPRPLRPGRRQRRRQVDPAPPDRRRAAPTTGLGVGRRRGRLPPPGPHPRRRPAVDDFLGIGAARRARSGPSRPAPVDHAPLRRDRRRLGRRGARGRRARPARPARRRARPPARRALRRRGHPARAHPAAAAPPRRAPARRADQQPRRRRPGAPLRRVEAWSRSLLVVSHDRELLERMDRIGDLRDGAVRWYGGGYSAYAAQVAAEQEAAEQAVTTARSDVRRQQRRPGRGRAGAGPAQAAGRAQRRRPGWARRPGQLQANQAEESAAKYRDVHDDRLERGPRAAHDAESRLREDREIRVDLPGTEVPRGRVVLTTLDLVLRTGAAVDLEMRGPDRIAVVGPNGSGKTTLLHTIAGELDRLAARSAGRCRSRCSPSGSTCSTTTPRSSTTSRAAHPAPTPTRSAPGSPASSSAARRRPPGRRPLRRRAVPRDPGRAAAGRPGAAAAAARRADQQPRLRVVRRPGLGAAAYRGALVVASHDAAFLEDIGVARTVHRPCAGLRCRMATGAASVGSTAYDVGAEVESVRSVGTADRLRRRRPRPVRPRCDDAAVEIGCSRRAIRPRLRRVTPVRRRADCRSVTPGPVLRRSA